MATFHLWARPLDLLPWLDHTWVTTYNPVDRCPPDAGKGAFWYCWGDCHTTNPDDGAVLAGQAGGNLAAAKKQSKPNAPDDHAGITGFYGQHGVCHQVANRVLAAAGSGLQVDQTVRGHFMSELLYGPYGSDGTFTPARGARLMTTRPSASAMKNMLRGKLGRDFSAPRAAKAAQIALDLRKKKDQLAAMVESGQMTVVEFAEELNREIARASVPLRDALGPDRAAALLGESDAGLLDVKIAAAEDARRRCAGTGAARGRDAGAVKKRKPAAGRAAQDATSRTSKAMSKSAVARSIAATTGLSRKEVDAVMTALAAEIRKCVGPRGPGQFTLPGLIKFVRVRMPARPARQVRNPLRPGETITVAAKPARSAIKVRALKQLKAMVR